MAAERRETGPAYVLVGGEAMEWMGVEPLKRRIFHTSTNFVCRAYNSLRELEVPSSSIITICQVRDYLDGLEAARNHPDFDKSLSYGVDFARRGTLAVAERLLQEGGPTYDGKMVNPYTVWCVLSGEAHPEIPVVVDHRCRLLFFSIYSHGSCYPVDPEESKAKGERHIENEAPVFLDPMKNEWFAFMPYPPHVPAPHLLDFCSITGQPQDVLDECTTYLYSVQLRAIFCRLFAAHPTRPVIGLLNYCQSGGNLDFMRRPAAVKYYHADKWPLWLMSSSSRQHNSLVGGLWSSFFSLLPSQLPSHEKCTSLTLQQFYDLVVANYRKEYSYELLNVIKSRAYPHYENKDIDTFHSDLEAALFSGPDSTIDYEGIKNLQTSYRDGSKYGKSVLICVPKEETKEVDLPSVVRECYQLIALPENVYGEKSGVDNFPMGLFFPSDEERAPACT